LKELYFNKDFSRMAVEKTMGALSKTASVKPLQTVSLNTLDQLRKNKEGWPQPDFTLLDEHEEKWRLAENDGLPLYIIFFASWNHASIKEMMLLEKLAETYQKDIRIVAINMDEKVDDFKKYLQAHPKQKFTFLYGYGNILLKENFALKAIPHAVMLAPDLTVKYTTTPLPSQGLEVNFKKIKQQAAAAGQGPKTWNRK
jgi:thiol-disulfide isomerase/thioredoxin